MITSDTIAPSIPAFEKRLGELGWSKGGNLAIDYGSGEGRAERFPAIIADFVGVPVDVIVTGGNGVMAAKRATSTIPIVFVIASDPVGAGMVSSLARPGGNVTGLSLQFPDTAGKRLQLLREVLPGLARLGVLVDAGYAPAMAEASEAEKAARTLGIAPASVEVRRKEDIAPAIASVKADIEALYVCGDALVSSTSREINRLALAAHLPTIYPTKADLADDGLMSYGPSFTAQLRRAAEIVDKILRGARPADLPVEQPTEFELVVNSRIAKRLGLTIPRAILAGADEVIE